MTILQRTISTADAFFSIFGMTRKPTLEKRGKKHRETKHMTVARKKPFLGWAFESPKGKFYSDVWTYKPTSYDYPSGDWKLVKVQISKYIPKKAK